VQHCEKVKSLGSIFTTNLKDNADVEKRTKSATKALHAMKNGSLTDQDVLAVAETAIRVYDATVINILPWECESWALKKELQRKLEV